MKLLNKIKTYIYRAFLLNKRLIKKPSFILILCLIPLLTLSMVLFTREESGVVTVLLAEEDSKCKTSNEIIDTLLESDSMIRFIKCDSVEEAEETVGLGSAHAAWIFPADIDSRITSFALNMNETVVRSVEKEDSISLKLARERLSGVLFPYISKAIFKNFMTTEVFESGEISEKEITEGYDNAIGGGNLVVLEQLDGSNVSENENYLTAPLRGILSLAVLLCGLAAVMYHQSDRENRVYDWLSPRKQLYPGIATIASAAFDSAVIIIVALALSGLFTSVLWEIISALAFVIAVTAFCSLVGTLTKKAAVTGQITPFIIMIALVVSPIFFDLANVKLLQLVFPTYYYLCSVFNPVYIAYTMLYSAVVFGVCILINRFTEE